MKKCSVQELESKWRIIVESKSIWHKSTHRIELPKENFSSPEEAKRYALQYLRECERNEYF